MRYVTGSVAEQLEERPEVAPQRRAQPRPRLDVIEGTRSREAQAPATFRTAVASARVLACYAVVLCLAVLTIMGMTHVVLEQDASLTSQIDDAQAQSKQLEVQVAVNEDPARIEEYSTQVYGMVPATDVQTIDVSEGASSSEK